MASLSTLFRLSAILFVLVVTCSKMASACMCDPSHPQENACRADFVIVALVEGYNVGEEFYQIHLNKVFKANERAMEALKSGRIYPGPHDCAVYLVERVEYLITGYVSRTGYAVLNVCGSYKRPWNEVPKGQRRGFRGQYQLGCFNCTISQSIWFPEPPPHATSCSWDMMGSSYRGMTDCQLQQGVCKMTNAQVGCAWAKSDSYKSCVAKRESERREWEERERQKTEERRRRREERKNQTGLE